MIVRTLWGAMVLVGLHALAIRLGIISWLAQIDLLTIGIGVVGGVWLFGFVRAINALYQIASKSVTQDATREFWLWELVMTTIQGLTALVVSVGLYRHSASVGDGVGFAFATIFAVLPVFSLTAAFVGWRELYRRRFGYGSSQIDVAARRMGGMSDEGATR